MNLTDLFTQKNLLNSVPLSQSRLYYYLLGFFAALVIIAIILYLLKGMDLAIRMKQFYCFLTCGILGLVFTFANYQSLPGLGTGLFLALILILLFVWIVGILVWMLSHTKKLESKKVLEERFKKYLPSPKRK